MARLKLDWQGDKVVERVLNATRESVDESTEEAARVAAGSHWWRSRTGNLDSQIVNEPAVRTGNTAVKGRFGSTRDKGFYGLFLERRNAFLRPAADSVFPRLVARIRSRL